MANLALLGGSKARKKSFITQAIIGKEERKRLNRVLDTGILSGFVASAGEGFYGGRQVREFESLVKKYFKQDFAVAVNSATAALHIAVAACGIGPGDEVITTPYTMSASATCIIMQNAIPVFADIEERTFGLNPQELEKKITERTRAIIVVHLFGYPAKMDEILKVARGHNLYLIEDCAQAPGALYKNKLVGTLGDIGVFSLNQHKTITSGEGGFAITNDKRLALRMQLIRNHAEVVVEGIGTEEIDNMIGFNYRMTELEAAVSIGQFRQLDYLNDYRIDLAEYLTERLSKFKGLTLPQIEENNKHVYFSYPIRFKKEIVGVKRSAFVSALNAEGIPFGTGYVKPLYLLPLYQKEIAYGKKGCNFKCAFYTGTVDYSKGICPVAERMYEEELISTGICRYPQTKKDMDDVVMAFDKVFSNIDELEHLEL